MVDIARREDALLDKISQLVTERDLARMELAEERVAHRLTKKELQEVTSMVIERG